MNKSDIQLQRDIEEELSWDPKVNAALIGVSVDKGVVSLTGTVDTYAEKRAAAEAMKRVDGVRAVAEDLTVKVLGSHQRTDSEIAAAALGALKWDVWIPPTVTAKVQKGLVTLEGQVEWKYQRDAAQRAVSNLLGVVSVNNEISIKPSSSTAQVKEGIQAALQRQATADATSIRVGTADGTVTLSGSAASWHAIQDAEAAAWAAPGVIKVVNNLAMTGYAMLSDE